MVEADAGLPTPDEIRDQLKRMLAGKRFTANENASRFLALVVDMRLRGERITQSIIGAELVTRYSTSKEDVSDVRVTAKTLREVITDYYAHEGEDDPVLIELPAPPGKGAPKLPAGKAYAPLFSYNPHSEATRHYKLGEFYLKRGTAHDYPLAFHHFGEALLIAPFHVGAGLGAAEALCGYLDWLSILHSDEERQDMALRIAWWLDSVSAQAAKDWRQYAIGAWLLHLNKMLALAGENFAIALSMDRAATESYPPYLDFLADTCKTEEAGRLARKYLDARYADIDAHAVYAGILLSSQKHDEASAVLENALSMEKNSYKIHFLLWRLRLYQDRPDEAKNHFEQLRALADDATMGTISLTLKKLAKLPPSQ